MNHQRLDNMEQAWLNALRPALDPSLEDRERNRQRLLANLAVPVGVPDMAELPSPVTSLPATNATVAQTGVRRWLGSRALQLSAVAVLSGAIGAAVGYRWPRASHRSNTEPGETVSATYAARERAQGSAVDTVRDRDSHRNEPAVSPGGPALEPLFTLPRTPTRHAPPAASTRDAADQPQADPLIEELSLLRRAERAIRLNNGLLANGLLRELDARFPKGQLHEEREAARVMANCELSEPAERASIGGRFLAQHQQSVYAARVRAVCQIDVAKPDASATESALHGN
jgi:hypothetical protein